MSIEVRFCHHCWREHPPDASRCPSCGRSVTERVPYREALELALHCPEALTARRAAYLLGELGDSEAVSALIQTLDGDDPYVAAEAVGSLARLGTAAAWDRIRAAVEHRFVTVRAAARAALAADGKG